MVDAISQFSILVSSRSESFVIQRKEIRVWGFSILLTLLCQQNTPGDLLMTRSPFFARVLHSGSFDLNDRKSIGIEKGI
jgi:hypothetical protein